MKTFRFLIRYKDGSSSKQKYLMDMNTAIEHAVAIFHYPKRYGIDHTKKIDSIEVYSYRKCYYSYSGWCVAHRIISEEYPGNKERVFLFVKYLSSTYYFGDLSYPQIRNMPQDVDYWRTATSSDSDRKFRIEEVKLSKAQFEMLQTLQGRLAYSTSMLIPTKPWRPGMTREEEEAQLQENIGIESVNQPFYDIIYNTQREIKTIIMEAI